MTTAAILTLAFLAIIVFAIINLFLWFLEFVAATAKCLLAYLLSKPHDWKRSYFDIRVLFTKLLLVFSFAMLSPRAMVKHQNYIRNHYSMTKLKEKRKAKRSEPKSK